MKKITEHDKIQIRVLASELITHLKNDFGLTTDECIDTIYKYGKKRRLEDFSDYFYRTVLAKKGYIKETKINERGEIK